MKLLFPQRNLPSKKGHSSVSQSKSEFICNRNRNRIVYFSATSSTQKNAEKKKTKAKEVAAGCQAAGQLAGAVFDWPPFAQPVTGLYVVGERRDFAWLFLAREYSLKL
jgi:hypothetical protein